MGWRVAARRVAAAVVLAASSNSVCRVALAGHAADGVGNATALTKESFDGFLSEQRSQRRPCLVMFHVDWCKVCKRTFPKYAAASDQVVERKIGMAFAHVDCGSDKPLCQRYRVKGYPTINLFQPEDEAEVLSYRSQRSEEGFVHYAERMTRPPVRPFLDAASLEEAMRNETFAAFLSLSAQPGAEAAPAPPAFAAMAQRWRDRHLFAVAPSWGQLLPKGTSVPAGATVAVLSQGSQQWPGADNSTAPPPAVAFFEGPLDSVEGSGLEALAQWVNRTRFPGISSLGDRNFYEFTHSSRRVAMLAVDPQRVSVSQETKLRKTAHRLRDDFMFGVLDGSAWVEELAEFNIAKQSLPRVLVVDDDFAAWYEDSEELRLDSLEGDLRSLLSGDRPLLRQGRGVMSKLFFYKREAARAARWLRSFAARGPKQLAVACAIAAAGLVALMAAGWCFMACCRVILSEEPEPDWPEIAAAVNAKAKAKAAQKKKD